MLAGRTEIQDAGITHVLDNRIEWSHGKLVRAHAPNLGLMWNGADDVGLLRPDVLVQSCWVGFALEALDDPDAQVLAYGLMGINRGPAMAYAILLRTWMDPLARCGSLGS
jgi:dual specificity phosphatase 3